MEAFHVNTEEAVLIHRDIQAKFSVAILWWTFNLTDEPMEEPLYRLREVVMKAQKTEERFYLKSHG